MVVDRMAATKATDQHKDFKKWQNRAAPLANKLAAVFNVFWRQP